MSSGNKSIFQGYSDVLQQNVRSKYYTIDLVLVFVTMLVFHFFQLREIQFENKNVQFWFHSTYYFIEVLLFFILIFRAHTKSFISHFLINLSLVATFFFVILFKEIDGILLIFLVNALAAYIYFSNRTTSHIYFLINVISFIFCLIFDLTALFEGYEPVDNQGFAIKIATLFLLVYKVQVLINLHNNTLADLTKSQSKYFGLMKNSNDGIIHVKINPISIHSTTKQQANHILEGLIAEYNDAFVDSLHGFDINSIYKKTIKEAAGHYPIELLESMASGFIQQGYSITDFPLNRGEHTDQELYLNINLYGIIKDEMLSGIWVTVKNVTQIQIQNRKIQESERTFRTLFENAPYGVTFRNIATGELEDVNQQILNQTGYTKEEFFKKTRLSFTHWEDRKRTEKETQRLLNGEIDSFSAEKQYYHKDGKVYWASITRTKMRLNGKDYIIGFVKDIHAIKMAQLAVEESENRFRGIVENTNDIFILTHKDELDKIKFVSPTIQKELGYTQEEFINKGIKAYCHSDELRDFVIKRIQLIEKNEKESISELRLRNSKDEFIWYECKISQLKMSEKGVERDFILTVFRNIHKEREARENLMYSEELYRLVVNSGYDGIEIFQPSRDNIIVNDKLKKILTLSDNGRVNLLKNAPKAQSNGISTHDLLKRKEKQLQHKKAVRFEIDLFNKNNALLTFEISKFRLIIGDELTVVTIFKDITFRKIQERTIERKNEELQKYIESNMQLENFAYIASHDLREPLRSITSFSQLLKRSLEKDERIKENEVNYLYFLEEASKRMEQLINDLLAYSRINSYKNVPKKMNIRNEINDIVIDLQSVIKQKSAIINLHELPPYIYADGFKIRQLFQNLISNGLKFSKKDGHPVIDVYGEDLGSHWKFIIKDNGIGIEKTYFNQIFLLFKRLHNRTDYEGTGIGLALCKKIVEQHEGEIWIDSQVNEYTAFHFTIKKDLSSSSQNENLPTEEISMLS